MLSRNPIARNAWKFNKSARIEDKRKDKRVKPSELKRNLHIWSGGREA